jgi:hypothetical protein
MAAQRKVGTLPWTLPQVMCLLKLTVQVGPHVVPKGTQSTAKWTEVLNSLFETEEFAPFKATCFKEG